ncbi:hypothetical protein [Lacicoccus alkaliphilus]|uniref:Uncharacterized protein n=1 Tax=Lacicoccus alkaliphilus DSM 16010 TaxID=1123231 RepID=A0A1M7I4L6_9BACL|nr:hypothetical protein [Salinicoccus alkaliphilus]SHM35608.1 hypothetical protein SAMN02745189_02026 [Salinicoccus alkaliphilus DSM 16010]
MILNIMYIVLIISIAGFLITGMLSILQFGGYFKKHERRYVIYFLTFTAMTIILMGIFTLIAS